MLYGVLCSWSSGHLDLDVSCTVPSSPHTCRDAHNHPLGFNDLLINMGLPCALGSNRDCKWSLLGVAPLSHYGRSLSSQLSSAVAIAISYPRDCEAFYKKVPGPSSSSMPHHPVASIFCQYRRRPIRKCSRLPTQARPRYPSCRELRWARWTPKRVFTTRRHPSAMDPVLSLSTRKWASFTRAESSAVI